MNLLMIAAGSVFIATCLCMVTFVGRISDALEDMSEALEIIADRGQSPDGLQVPPINEWRVRREAE